MTEAIVYDKATVDAMFLDRDAKLAQVVAGLAANNALDQQQATAIAQILAGTPTTPPPPVTTTPPPTIPVGVPFLPTSTWNTKVPANPTYTDVPAIKQGGGWCNWGGYTAAIARSTPSDPVVTITLPGSWGWPAGVATLRIPAGVDGSPGTDGNLIVIDGDTEWDFWQFRRTGNTASCVSYAKCNVRTDTGWGTANPFKGAGIHASGSSLFAGLIVGNELTQGISHAIAIACPAPRVLPSNSGTTLVNGAISSDGWGGPIPYSARFAIPRTVAAPANATPQGKVLWKALQEYGAFVVDTTGNDPHGFIVACDYRSVPEADAAALNGVNASWTAPDLGAMANALRRIS